MSRSKAVAAGTARRSLAGCHPEQYPAPTSYFPRFSYSLHQVALGRSGLRQAPRQSHLQLSQRKTCIPSALLRRTTSLSLNPGPPAAVITLLYFLSWRKDRSHP